MFERIVNMRQDLKNFIYAIGVGVSLIAYAHATFATRPEIISTRTAVSENSRAIRDASAQLNKRLDKILEILLTLSGK